jgi:hypothetical protein
MPPPWPRLQINCFLERIRATTYNGTTGNVALDDVGDRYGSFGIFNYVDTHLVKVGHIDESVVNGVDDVLVDVDIPSISWSDGITGRSIGPDWGATTLAPTPSPTAANSEVPEHTGGTKAVLVPPHSPLLSSLSSFLPCL